MVDRVHHLRSLFLKLFSQLRIPAESEIRDLQLKQMKNASGNTNNFEIEPNRVQSDYDQVPCRKDACRKDKMTT